MFEDFPPDRDEDETSYLFCLFRPKQGVSGWVIGRRFPWSRYRTCTLDARWLSCQRRGGRGTVGSG